MQDTDAERDFNEIVHSMVVQTLKGMDHVTGKLYLKGLEVTIEVAKVLEEE
jgi:hypothetical protein